MSESALHPEDLAAETIDTRTVAAIRKSVRVATTVERAFAAFTEEVDSWWPRPHCINGSPMGRVVFERKIGGAIYSDQEGGTASRWGTLLDWDPPNRIVMAWQVSPLWLFESDLAKCSEIEVTFRPIDDGLSTLVELVHRALEHHGDDDVEVCGASTVRFASDPFRTSLSQDRGGSMAIRA